MISEPQDRDELAADSAESPEVSIASGDAPVDGDETSAAEGSVETPAAAEEPAEVEVSEDTGAAADEVAESEAEAEVADDGAAGGEADGEAADDTEDDSTEEDGDTEDDDPGNDDTEDAGAADVVAVSDDAGVEDAGDDSEVESKQWYILKVQVNREDSIRDALTRRVKIAGLDEYFGDIVVPTEEVAEFTKSGKRRVVKRKLFPGYIMAHMVINDDTWFLVRETPGIGDFTGSAGKPTPMEAREVERIIKTGDDDAEGAAKPKSAIKFKVGDRVRVKDGYFQNFEGEVEGVDEANGRITVMINIFGRSTPVELEHWQVEDV